MIGVLCSFTHATGCCLREKRSFLKETILRVYAGKEGHTAPTGGAIGERKTSVTNMEGNKEVS